MSSLFYSCLSQFGYSKHTTVFAAKMLANTLYGCRYETFDKNKSIMERRNIYKCLYSDFMAAVLVDSSDFLLSATGLYTEWGDSYVMQCFVSFLSSVAIGYAAQVVNQESTLPSKVIYDVLHSSVWNFLLPIEGVSPVIDYVPEVVYSWCHNTAIPFTESGLSVA
ncbi:MAG: hypothetical protein ACK5WS_02530 [Alphaproteobacteria bacterium]|jgi:hypothetical protein|nr:hypothetical protein [Candidatus Jidaibacter sp.]